MSRFDYVFVDIDTQHDFMDPDGKLYVPGAEEIVPRLKRLLGAAAACHIPVLSSADCHSPDDPEFEQFPPHCIRGTAGQRKLCETLLDHRTIVEPHDMTPNPAALLALHDQIIFHKTTFDVFSNRNFARVIDSIEAERFIVFGVATDYCVRAAALGLLHRDCQVTIVSDAVRAVARETEAEACEALRAAGADWGTTDHIVESVGEHHR
jgi:nicotinamidase/pyrazinamidase